MELPPSKADEPHWLQVQRGRRFNDAGREIWFCRLGGWSYMPSHWKGYAALIIIISLAMTTGFFLDDDMSGLFAVPLLAGLALLMFICERHSPTRR